MASESAAAGLTLSDDIPITWRAVDYTPDDAQLASVSETNEAFLRTVSAIGVFSTELPEDTTGVSQEITRLDLKVNLLLDLVSQLIYQQLDMPESSRVTLSSQELTWHSERVPKPGLTVFVQAYVQRGTPKPLSFYAKVVSSEQEYLAGCARVCYIGLCGSVLSWLDKLIFRHHRREVAFKKSKISQS